MSSLYESSHCKNTTSSHHVVISCIFTNKQRGAEELADALTYVLIRANYPFVISECELLLDTLSCFVEDFDSCLIQVLTELCKQFKNVTDYIRTHSDSLGFSGDVSQGTEEISGDDEDEVTRMLRANKI